MKLRVMEMMQNNSQSSRTEASLSDFVKCRTQNNSFEGYYPSEGGYNQRILR